jgi:hypothetical protein
MLSEFDKISGRKFETARILMMQLMNTIDPLQKYGTSFVQIITSFSISTSIGEFMTETKPFFFD